MTCVQHLKEFADEAFSQGKAYGGNWFDKCRTIQFDDAKGNGRTIDAFRHLIRSGPHGAILGGRQGGWVTTAGGCLVKARPSRQNAAGKFCLGAAGRIHVDGRVRA